MKVNFSRRFEKQRAKLPKLIKLKLSDRLRLFLNEPSHPFLRNHPLSGKYVGYRSINVTGDYRAIFYYESTDIVRFIAIGTHSELYG